MNRPVNFNDPTGHKACGDDEGSECNTSNGQNPNKDKPAKIKKELESSSNGDEPSEDDGSGNWLMDRYKLGWKNAEQAWTIVTNPNASFGQRLGASAYLTGWVGFGHVGGAIGTIGVGCASFIVGCAKVLSRGPILIQGFARGGAAWHIGVETIKNMNIIHIGNHTKFGVHIAIGAVRPFVGDLHIYFEKSFPFIRIWKP